MFGCMYTDLKYLVCGSSVAILALVGIMFFSPLASQFVADGAGRGASWKMDIDELIDSNQHERALSVVDSLIDAKRGNLPRFAYFDRFLSEDERYDAANARADIYELQWMRIELLSAANNTSALREALEEYVGIIGYNRDAAKCMLKLLNDK